MLRSSTLFVLLSCAFLGLTSLPAQQPTPDEPIHTVTHVDFMPNHVQSVAALESYVAQEKHDPNLLHVELLQQISAPNHFTLLETFRNLRAYNAHIEAESTRRFRAQVEPALGSPFDERLFRDHTPQ